MFHVSNLAWPELGTAQLHLVSITFHIASWILVPVPVYEQWFSPSLVSLINNYILDNLHLLLNFNVNSCQEDFLQSKPQIELTCSLFNRFKHKLLVIPVVALVIQIFIICLFYIPLKCPISLHTKICTDITNWPFSIWNFHFTFMFQFILVEIVLNCLADIVEQGNWGNSNNSVKVKSR
jgi:hypothetical protein